MEGDIDLTCPGATDGSCCGENSCGVVGAADVSRLRGVAARQRAARERRIIFQQFELRDAMSKPTSATRADAASELPTDGEPQLPVDGRGRGGSRALDRFSPPRLPEPRPVSSEAPEDSDSVGPTSSDRASACLPDAIRLINNATSDSSAENFILCLTGRLEKTLMCLR